jgi:hypothetical protein
VGIEAEKVTNGPRKYKKSPELVFDIFAKYMNGENRPEAVNRISWKCQGFSGFWVIHRIGGAPQKGLNAHHRNETTSKNLPPTFGLTFTSSYRHWSGAIKKTPFWMKWKI